MNRKKLKDKIFIKGMNESDLQKLCIEAGEPYYKGIQIFKWMYYHGISSFESMHNIKKSFRKYLEKKYILQTLKVEKKISSNKDKSVKILFKTQDCEYIETVSMLENNRHTVCISSQVGCALDCSFCATAKLGFKRNLEVGEIVDQLIYIREKIKIPITNVVFMGMGEPFHNYENVLCASDIFHSHNGFNLAATRITISTAGMLPQIERFIKENRRYKLAISLNASNDLLRNNIMPINSKWNIKNLIKAGKKYSNQKKRMVMFEYVLLKGVNDSDSDANELANLLKGIRCKLNLIPYNEINGKYRRPDINQIKRFSEILFKKQNEYRVLVRWSKGQDIDAGCGQLAGKVV